MFAILPIHVHVLPGVSGYSLTNIPLVFCFHQSLWWSSKFLWFQYIWFYAHDNHSYSVRLQSSFLINLSFQKERSPVQFVTIIGGNILNTHFNVWKSWYQIVILDHGMP